MENNLSIEEQKLVLNTQIKERSLIIYVIESAIADEDFNEHYQRALLDEIENHKAAIEDYNQSLSELSKPQP